VSPAWLSDARDRKLLVVDCEHPATFECGHIPSAQSLGLATTGLKDPRSLGVIDQRVFAQVLALLRVEEDSTLVFYDDDRGLKSTRAWWVFHHFGFPKDQLKVLDGGWKQWLADMNQAETGPPVPTKATAPFWNSVKDSGALVNLAAVKKGLADGTTQFVDARTPAEYSGVNPNGNARAGHVPGAVNFDWTTAVSDVEGGRFLSKAVLDDVVSNLYKLRKDAPVVTYCQRGIRAAHTAFVLSEVLGFSDVKVYEDSMAEYLNRDDTVVE
jgi:thiosulfate/3-mercaptopyruvate sulfurtransferase